MSARMLLTESELFVYLRDFYWPDLLKSNTFDGWDCVSYKTRTFAELKSRYTHYDELLIEEMKYDGILNAAKFFDFEPRYINSTPDGIWSFNLADMPEPEWSMRLMPSTTEFENKDKKMKSVGFISIKDGVPL